jgi:hypothetical protein
VSRIAAGQWERVAEIGKGLQATFILGQSLSPAQRTELHHALPAGFLELDRAFHRHAGMLARAAEMGNGEVVGFYFYKLIDGCVACHARHARHRYPAFAAPPRSHRHQELAP